MKILNLSASVRRQAEELMERIYSSERVACEDYVRLESWRRDMMEVLARMSEEFQQDFLRELKRQVLRLGGRPVRIQDAAIANSVVALADQLDPIMNYRRHPAVELLRMRCRNLLAPFGNVLYRGQKFVVRRNRYSISVRFTASLAGQEVEKVMDRLDDVMEEDGYVG